MTLLLAVSLSTPPAPDHGSRTNVSLKSKRGTSATSRTRYQKRGCVTALPRRSLDSKMALVEGHPSKPRAPIKLTMTGWLSAALPHQQKPKKCRGVNLQELPLDVYLSLIHINRRARAALVTPRQRCRSAS
jgi:hypothetical protein